MILTSVSDVQIYFRNTSEIFYLLSEWILQSVKWQKKKSGDNPTPFWVKL